MVPSFGGLVEAEAAADAAARSLALSRQLDHE
jgi:hypothetical protein